MLGRVHGIPVVSIKQAIIVSPLSGAMLPGKRKTARMGGR
ncbi:hypothetical protein HMPREF9080_00265 [Cardiobacterium valvarum F0432]|uniref:Uncharacterized protein n=1 Tax=Cardiobacterium valvarum F0432 TaxID=797473 RepID=G9ZBY7_9GAMM|nr:hypothetical protein HMPREF9080_00265 [Cardiobacterium valvarum F0432]